MDRIIQQYEDDPSSLEICMEDLFDGDVYPTDYDRQILTELDEGVYDRREYARGTEAMITVTRRQWDR